MWSRVALKIRCYRPLSVIYPCRGSCDACGSISVHLVTSPPVGRRRLLALVIVMVCLTTAIARASGALAYYARAVVQPSVCAITARADQPALAVGPTVHFVYARPVGLSETLCKWCGLSAAG